MRRLELIIGTTMIVGLTVLTGPLTVEAVVHPGAQPAASVSNKPRFTTGQLIVKYKDSVTECVHCLIRTRKAFKDATTDHSDSLDRLHAKYQVKSAVPIFRTESEETRLPSTTLVDLKSYHQQRLEEVKQRFALRAQRVSKDAAVPDVSRVYVLELAPEVNLEAAVVDFTHDPHVEYAQPNFLVETAFTPNDPYYSSCNSWDQGCPGDTPPGYNDLWGLQDIHVAQAWDVTQGQGIVVAVVDTGLDYNHPDIQANVWTNSREIADNKRDDDGNGYQDDVRGWNFINNNNNPQDGNGHGTHVSGTIAAVGNNNLGIIGVAPRTKLIPVKGLDDTGTGTSATLAQALVYAAQNGADVINNSWACSSPCPANPVLEEAVRTAHGVGAVVVFAAGNGSDDVLSYSPQNMIDPKPIVVAATSQQDAPTFFTNFGVLVDVSAPGGGPNASPPSYDPFRNILSLRSAVTDTMFNPASGGQRPLEVGDGYIRQAGTSMAAPYVTGVAALILASRSSLSNDDVRQVLRTSADDVNSPGFDLFTGAGRIHAAKALGVTSVLHANVTSPLSGSIFGPSSSPVVIAGTASGPGFQQYQLFYGRGMSPSTWTPITDPVIAPVDAGTLGTWMMGTVPTGLYLVRLVVTDTTGQQFQDVVEVIKEDPLTQITSDGSTESSPAISDNRIVWQRLGGTLNWDLYLYDLTTRTERPITTAPADQRWPAISGNQVVWADFRRGNSDIYLYDLLTNTERQMTTTLSPRIDPTISSDWIAWEDYNSTSGDIYLYDLATNSERQMTNAPESQFSPTISGNVIVWSDFSLGPGANLYLYDLSSNSGRQMTFGGNSLYHPVISGTRVVSENDRNGNWDIYLYDLTTGVEQRITTDPAVQRFPVISGNNVVWEDYRNGNADIYVYDLLTNTERQITSHPSAQINPAISGDWVVWEDYRNGQGDIYAYRLTNKPPVVDNLPNPTVNEGELLTFTVTASDPDNDPLTLVAHLANGEPLTSIGASFIDGGNGTGTFSWTPSFAQAGTYVVTLMAMDSRGLSCSETMTITVTDVPLQVLSIHDGPDPFSPNGDGVDDQTILNATFNHEIASGQLLIQNSIGATVRNFTYNGPRASITQSWDGKQDDLVTYVPNGTYTYVFSVQDGGGSRASQSGSVTVDTQTFFGLNLLSNGNFEAGKSDWSGWGTNKLLTLETSFDGTTAAKMLLGAKVSQLTHTAILVTGGKPYRITFAIKTVDVTGSAYAQVQWQTGNGKPVRTDLVSPTSGTTGWQLKASILTAPSNATKIRISLVGSLGSGTAYFDAVELHAQLQ